MDDLNEWLDAWKPIRAGFEKLSLDCGDVVICFWPGNDANAGCERFYNLQSVGRSLRLGLVGSQQLGSISWCLLHGDVAREARRELQDESDLGTAVDTANRTCSAFMRHAEHAGDLLLEAPKELEFEPPVEWSGFRGLKLWIAVLFGEADQPPDYMLGTQPYYPLWCDALNWPHEIRTLVDNPFMASVKLINFLRLGINQNILETARSAELSGAKAEARRLRSANGDLLSKRQSEVAQKPRPNGRAMTADETKLAMGWIRELVNDLGETEAIHRAEIRTGEPQPHGFGKTISASTLRRAWKRTNPAG